MPASTVLPALGLAIAIAMSCSLAISTAWAQVPGPVASQRAFVSGHSLIDNPMPEYLAQIAASLGTPLQWNRQYMEGSSIRHRTRGRGRNEGWDGYSSGSNRDGEGLDVIEEIRRPRATDGKPYDTLVITEQHGVLDALVLHDTVRYLRHYHDRFIDGNARGKTWFYEPWLGVIDKSKPARWIAYERAAAPMWQCIVTRVNTSLEAEGRPDRIQPLPASTALAALVERAVHGKVNGFPAGDPRSALDMLFHDTVHLTRLGSYYMALSSYAALHARSPAGAWAPDEVNPRLAASLQGLAWELVSNEQASRTPLPLAACNAYMKQFTDLYVDHMRDDYWAQQGPSLHTTYRRWRHGLQWRWQLWRHFGGNAFSFDAASDRSRWFRAP